MILLLMRLAIVVILIAPDGLYSQGGSSLPKKYTSIPVSIDMLKKNPSRYDGKVIETSGILRKGHFGAFLTNEKPQSLVRIVPSSLPTSADSMVTRDALYSCLMKCLSPAELPGEVSVTYETKIIGILKVIKNREGSASVFYPQEGWPVEIIPLQVLEIRVHN